MKQKEKATVAASSSSVVMAEQVSARTRWSYGIGCIGRDATYTLVSNFIMTYLTLAVGLSTGQLFAVGIIMIAARVWDAINDPMMGTIIDNTQTRWGKFKPYIIAGALLNSFFTVMLFSNPAKSETMFVVIFAITYILWGMSYTMNDISYWSMLPSLSVNQKERERVSSLARIGANIGLFTVTALVPAFTSGGMGSMYRPIAIAVVIVFIACQLLVIIGVQEKKNDITSVRSHTTLKDMVGIVFKNDQLMAIATAIFLFNTGYFITTGFGMQFFYFDYGNFGGMEFTIFAISIGVAQVVTLAFYPLLSKRMNRRQLFKLAIVLVLIGYACFMAVGYLLPMNMIILCGIGLVLFSGQAIIQLLNYVLLADTIEYGQWKLGTRNESITFSLNPFITKLASAVQAGVFSLTLAVSGLNTYSNQISKLEQEMSLVSENATQLKENIIAKGGEIVASIPAQSVLILRISMLVFPLFLILGCYYVYRTYYKIDETMYANIISDLSDRGKK